MFCHYWHRNFHSQLRTRVFFFHNLSSKKKLRTGPLVGSFPVSEARICAFAFPSYIWRPRLRHGCQELLSDFSDDALSASPKPHLFPRARRKREPIRFPVFGEEFLAAKKEAWQGEGGKWILASRADCTRHCLASFLQTILMLIIIWWSSRNRYACLFSDVDSSSSDRPSRS